jgi:hypothetical protein
MASPVSGSYWCQSLQCVGQDDSVLAAATSVWMCTAALIGSRMEMHTPAKVAIDHTLAAAGGCAVLGC